jgi:hypothetical protein
MDAAAAAAPFDGNSDDENQESKLLQSLDDQRQQIFVVAVTTMLSLSELDDAHDQHYLHILFANFLSAKSSINHRTQPSVCPVALQTEGRGRASHYLSEAFLREHMRMGEGLISPSSARPVSTKKAVFYSYHSSVEDAMSKYENYIPDLVKHLYTVRTAACPALLGRRPLTCCGCRW